MLDNPWPTNSWLALMRWLDLVATARLIETASMSPSKAIANASGASAFRVFRENSGTDTGGRCAGISPINAIEPVKLLRIAAVKLPRTRPTNKWGAFGNFILTREAETIATSAITRRYGFASFKWLIVCTQVLKKDSPLGNCIPSICFS